MTSNPDALPAVVVGAGWAGLMRLRDVSHAIRVPIQSNPSTRLIQGQGMDVAAGRRV